MRKSISFLTILTLALTFGISSCKSDARKKIKETREKMSNTKNMVKSLSKMEENMNQLGKDAEGLKNIDPFNNERFQNWMPERLDGMKRTSYEFTSSMGSQGKMNFEDENGDRSFQVTIIDGAGEMGSAVYASQGFITGFMDDYHSESDTKVERVVKRKDGKALETYYKEENSSEIKAVVDNRFIVIAQSSHMNVDETWKLIDQLKVGRLK